MKISGKDCLHWKEQIINIENVINKIADIEEKEKEINSKLNEYLKTLGFVS